MLYRTYVGFNPAHVGSNSILEHTNSASQNKAPYSSDENIDDAFAADLTLLPPCQPFARRLRTPTDPLALDLPHEEVEGGGAVLVPVLAPVKLLPKLLLLLVPNPVSLASSSSPSPVNAAPKSNGGAGAGAGAGAGVGAVVVGTPSHSARSG